MVTMQQMTIVNTLIQHPVISRYSLLQKINQTENASDSRGKASVAIWRVSGTSGEPQVYLEIPSADDFRSVVSSLTFSPDAGASHVLLLMLCTDMLTCLSLGHMRAQQRCHRSLGLARTLAQQIRQQGPAAGIFDGVHC